MRFAEIDFLRGIAILMMVFYHIFYDMNVFGSLPFSTNSSIWLLLSRFTASLFILIAGISLTLSYNHTTNPTFRKFLLRGFSIFCVGLFITLATWLFVGQGAILFGILHLIGLSIILGYFFLRYVKVNLFMLGVLIIVFGIALSTQRFDFPWLLWLGFTPSSMYSLDYVPLLPWFGVFLIGMEFGTTFYANGKRQYSLPKLFSTLPTAIVSFLGQHSLAIYLLHQPIIMLLLYAFGFVHLPPLLP
jgi:uncharacterized membrane protein